MRRNVGRVVRSVAVAVGLLGLVSGGGGLAGCALEGGPADGARQVETSRKAAASQPVVTTTAATLVTGTTAQLNGAANPGEVATTGWFRFSTTDPGTCNDTFGSRAPGSGGTLLGSGTTVVAYSQGVTGLTPATTYYFCAIAENSLGKAYGAVLSFTTPDVPTVVTAAATSVTASSATLGGSGNPNGWSTVGWFRYSTTDPGTCNDTFGTRAPTSGGSSLGSGTSPVDYTRAVSGLAPGTTYYFCAIASNTYGTNVGAVLSFTTPAVAPVVTTSAATLVTGTTAQLNGTGNPGGAATTGWFRYATASPGTCNDTFGTRAPGSGGTLLASGTTAVAYSQGVTGLTPGTTYYFCAIAQNALGMGFGVVQSFTTPSAPTVTTSAATSLTSTSATLNGLATPNGAAATGWFRYGLTDPGTCNDIFGSRAPASGGTSLGSGTSAVAYSRSISGLSAGTTYYSCAIAQNAEGLSFGEVVSFTTADAPTVTTEPATNVTASSAMLNGTATPNGTSSYGYYRYSTTNPGACNDSFGTRAPTSSTSDTFLGSGTDPVAYARGITGLAPGTTYYFCAIARNSYGTRFGSLQSFTTPAAPPTVTTSSATLLTGTTAQLNGSANPGGAATTGWFRYATASPGTCNDSFGTRAPTSGGASLGSGTSNVAFSQGVTGLSAGTTYYVCAIAQSAAGMGFGAVVTFTTPVPPLVTTNPATSITNSSAYLQGSATPNGSATTGWFRYATANPGTCNDTFGSRAPTSGGTSLGSGYSAMAYNRQVTGLSAGTTYYYCAIVQSAEGTAYGAVLSFTTAGPPTVVTNAASSVTSSSAVLNGTATPNGDASYGYFRYATTDPGTCSDSFGTRAPSSGGTSLGSGTNPVAYARTVSGLAPGTTYYYCAIAYNSYGTRFGDVQSFTTPAAAPTVTTNNASLLTGNTAQLNGTANPGGAATTAWFRYATSSPGTCNDTFGTRAPISGGASLGSGTSNVAFSQGVTGLTPGTTYYVCAIAQNSTGISFGSVVTFTTPVPPSVTTNPATSITNSSAYLQGSATPNGSAATGWFRYSTTDPGTCDDTFGSRAPASGGTSLGSGTSAVSYNRQVTGLSAGSTYYYCAIASSAEGTAFGAVLTVTTADAPVVTTNAATSVTANSASLNGSADPNGNSTYGFFRYSTTNPGTCSDSFGARWPSSSSSDTSLGAGTDPVSYSRSLTSLAPGTTYYFCALARNSYGTRWGAVQSFTTLAAVPTVTTSNATLLTGTTAQLNGSANPGGAATTGWFRYGTVSPGSCNDSFGIRAPSSGGVSVGSGTSNVAFSQGITGLTAGTTYYVCAIAENSAGKGVGAVLTFTTPTPPTVTTSAATSVTNSSAYLQGAGTPNGSATTGWFRYSLTDPGICNDAFGSRAPASGGTSLGSGTSAVSYSRQVTGLSAGTTYYYCAIAQSAEGTAFGVVISFTTADAPVVTTSAATVVTSASATLNGSADPNGNSAYGYFRYATTNPGTCSDSFGTRAPTSSSSDTSLGAGTSPVAYSRGITGLLPGTTYYYCALARNSYGTRFGGVMSFTTLAALPTVTTSAASVISTTGATLNGSANPGGAATTGWFRYATASPGTCNDTFGTRAPASGGSNLGSGTSSVAFSQGITGLTPGTTYYVCAIAENSVGKAYGTVRSFTTTSPPTVTTLAATPVTATTSTLNGLVNPNGYSTTGWFRYDTVNPGTCNDTFGTATSTTALGSGTVTVNLAKALTGLTPATTYYFCAIAQSSIGSAFGTVLSFTTSPAPPAVTTTVASDVTDTTALLHATVVPNGSDTTGWFRYDTANPGTCNDTFGARMPASGGSALGAGSTPVDLALPVSALTAGTTYYYCALATNSFGTTVGTVLSFVTPTAPAATTTAATGVTSGSAMLNGSAIPNGGETTGWFRLGTTNPGTCNDSFGSRVPASGGTSLGSGTSAVAYSITATGLAAGQTYYYCAIAQNGAGTSYGEVLSFTTTDAPTVTTTTATAVTGTGATLNGAASPNGSATTGWFRYATTDPGTCDDSFGTRAPTSGGASLGTGTAPVPFAEALTGLSAGTTYYYCAIASNAAGTGVGPVLSFSTPAAPTVTTTAAAAVTATAATLNGEASPNGDATTGWFRYGTTNPGACNDSFGVRAPATGGASLGAGGAAVPFAEALTGLQPTTTYYFCAIAQNGLGVRFGAVLSFTTPAAPAVTTGAVTAVTSTGATLSGTANPNLETTSAWFRYDTTSPGTCNDTFGTRAPGSGGTALGAGASAVPFAQAVTGLQPSTTYFVCAIAQNASGVGVGAVVSFTTPAAPTVTTGAATSVTSTGATLGGLGNPNLDAATGWFRYDTADPGTCSDSFGVRAPTSGGASLGAGSAAVPFSQTVSGLQPGTTYYYCAIAQNATGLGVGAVVSFTTPATPTVTTEAVTSVTDTGATLGGQATPNFAEATGYFRYATTDPGACSDGFGVRAPATGGAALGAGAAAVSFTEALTGLAAGTTYYFCAIAQNAAGTGFGQVLSFTTPAAPTVTTLAASAVTSTEATLDGSAIPNLEAATGWFRYGTSDPGTCNDTFGTRAPATGGTVLGAGTAAVPFTEALTGLAPGTTYYYCAIAENQVGQGFGQVLSFTTPTAPTVVTEPVNAVTATGATLHGTGNPNLDAAMGWFRYDTMDPGTCDDSFGTRAPAAAGAALGAGGAAVPFAEAVTGLAAGTTYYYCAIAQNASGTSFGQVLSFTTPAPPTVTTEAASAVTSTGATLGGTATPNLDAATGYFRYDTADPGACSDTFGVRAPATGGAALGTGSAAVPFSETVSGLLPGTTYWYCAIAENGVGQSFGQVLSFTTTDAPVVTTEDATDLTSSGATLQGTVDPLQEDATAWFRYDTTDPGACDDIFGTRAPASGGTNVAAGAGVTPFSEAVTGLAPGTTYYICAIAENGTGASFGQVITFTTPADVPVVTTQPPTNVQATSAVLNAEASPGGDAATGWFRLDTVDPGTCDDSFGARVPVTGGATLGGGTAAVAFSEAVASLVPGTRYYYCALAANGAGTGVGQVVSFVAGAIPPRVTTEDASDLLTTSATLAGTANPEGTATTAWFRVGEQDPGTCDDSFGTRVPDVGGTDVGAGHAPMPVTEALTGLTSGTTYYYCAAASNAAGASFGQVRSFTTAALPPEVETFSAMVDGASATLNGQANPLGSETTAWFRYDTAAPAACDDTFGTRTPATGGEALGAGRDVIAFSEAIAGLAPGTYYYCAIAENAGGLGYGEVHSFVVPESPGSKKGGCGCQAGTHRGGPAALLFVLGILGLFWRRRRALHAGAGSRHRA